MDSSGFSSSHVDKYYVIIIRNKTSHYTTCHINIDIESRIILYTQAIKGHRNYMKFKTPSARAMKKYKQKYILADKAYDAEKLIKCINE